MKLLFIANSRIPTERAMGAAIMKQCEAFAGQGLVVELAVPRRHNEHTEDAFLYHGVKDNFRITYLWSLDLTVFRNSTLRSFFRRMTFFISACVYVWKSDADVLYGREPKLIGLIPTKKRKFVELHHLYGLRICGQKILSLCSGIITITHALKEDVVNRLNIKPDDICVAPSGVSLSQFESIADKDEVRARLGIHTKKPVTMYIGSFEEWKGYGTFLSATELVDDEVTFVVIGGSDAQVLRLRHEYPKVQFLGSLPERDLAYNQQAADVLVVPNSAKEEISARHTSPLKIFAHMASGIPIVASATTAIQEVLNEYNAILVVPDDSRALAEGVLQAIHEKENSCTRAVHAKEDVKKYDWNARTEVIVACMYEKTTD